MLVIRVKLVWVLLVVEHAVPASIIVLRVSYPQPPLQFGPEHSSEGVTLALTVAFLSSGCCLGLLAGLDDGQTEAVFAAKTKEVAYDV